MKVPEAAVAILHARGAEESVLLMRRSERASDAWSGQWSLPGGRCEPEDGSLEQTALRELEEECGIRLDPGCLESALPVRAARRRGGNPLLVAPFVFRVEQELPVVVDPREAVEARWVPVRILTDPARHSLQCVPGVSAEMCFPSIALGGAPLWGFTYRLLTSWLGLIPPEEPRDQPGPEAARIAEFLRSRGLEPVYGAADGSGLIPVSDVRELLAAPGAQIPQINAVEIRPEFIRIVGLGFEESYIRAGS